MQWIYGVIAATAVFTLACFWWAGRQEKARKQRRGSGDVLLGQLQDANAKLSAAVAAENAVMVAIALLPETVGPREALMKLRTVAPDWSEYDYQALMLHGWEVQRRRQALAALAGLGLHGKSNMSAMLWRALREGAAPLLDQIAAEIEVGFATLPPTVKTSGLPVTLRDAAARVEADAPAVADRLRRVADAVMIPIREQALDSLLLAIERQDDEGVVDLKTRVAELAKQCWPGFPELGEHVHAFIDRHDASEAITAHIWFDKAVLHHFYDAPHGLDGFDAGAAVERFAEGIMSSDAEVSRFGAEQAADALGDGFFGTPQYGDVLQGALDWAVNRHGMNPTYEWLESELNPPDLRPPRVRAEEQTIALHSQTNAGVKTLVETTSTSDPEVALAELRHLLPEVPVDMLRVALIARWRNDHAPMSLMALLGVALEVADGEPVDGKMVWLCLHWPLREGAADVVDAAVRTLEDRFERLDSWLHREQSIRDLDGVRRRLANVAPETSIRVGVLLERAKARRVTVLAASIAERLKRAEDEGERADPFTMMLDVYRWCLPDHPELGAPVRAILRRRSDEVAWRKTRIWLESAIIKHFGPLDQLDGYDFDVLIDLLRDGIADYNEEVAVVAAMTAADMVKRKIIARQKDLLTLEGAVDWAVPLHHTAPEAFTVLRNEIMAAYGRVGDAGA